MIPEIPGTPRRGIRRYDQAKVVVGLSSWLWVCPGISDHCHTISVRISLPSLCNVSVRRAPSPSDEELSSGLADAIYQRDKPKESKRADNTSVKYAYPLKILACQEGN